MRNSQLIVHKTITSSHNMDEVILCFIMICQRILKCHWQRISAPWSTSASFRRASKRGWLTKQRSSKPRTRCAITSSSLLAIWGCNLSKFDKLLLSFILLCAILPFIEGSFFMNNQKLSSLLRVIIITLLLALTMTAGCGDLSKEYDENNITYKN